MTEEQLKEVRKRFQETKFIRSKDGKITGAEVEIYLPSDVKLIPATEALNSIEKEYEIKTTQGAFRNLGDAIEGLKNELKKIPPYSWAVRLLDWLVSKS